MLGHKLTVVEAIGNGIKFDRVHFVNEELEGKSWGACSEYPSNNELIKEYGQNVCQQSIIRDTEGFYKYSLVVWVKPNDRHLKNIFGL